MVGVGITILSEAKNESGHEQLTHLLLFIIIK